MTRRLALLGATGSIGTSCLEVVRRHPDRFAVVAVASQGSRIAELEAIVREFRPRFVAVGDPSAAAALRDRLPAPTKVAAGPTALVEAALWPEADQVVAAVVGAAGLAPVWAALDAGRDVALANKEALVVAGGRLTALAAARGARLLPIDSEHVALHQALRSGRPEEVERLVLTASGGPFRERDLATFASIRPEEALRHPTWSMGAKISVDSATMVNKGLELIEARWLFDLPVERLDVLVHPQSIVHSFVEWRDGSWIAQLSANDMVFPIQYALTWPERWPTPFARLDPAVLAKLEFQPLDRARFPAVDLARQALAAGDSAPAVFNAANEIAVQEFLAGRLPFPAIVETIGAVLDTHTPVPIESLEHALELDTAARRAASEHIAGAQGTAR